MKEPKRVGRVSIVNESIHALPLFKLSGGAEQSLTHFSWAQTCFLYSTPFSANTCSWVFYYSLGMNDYHCVADSQILRQSRTYPQAQVDPISTWTYSLNVPQANLPFLCHFTTFLPKSSLNSQSNLRKIQTPLSVIYMTQYFQFHF